MTRWLSKTRLLLVLGIAVLAASCPHKPAAEGVVPGAAPYARQTATLPVPLPPQPKKWTGDAKDFEFTALTGQKLKLSDFAGEPIVLNFWADW